MKLPDSDPQSSLRSRLGSLCKAEHHPGPLPYLPITGEQYHQHHRHYHLGHHHPGPLPYLPITGLYLGYKLFIVIIIVIIKTEHRITLALFLTYQLQARIHLPENHKSPL